MIVAVTIDALTDPRYCPVTWQPLAVARAVFRQPGDPWLPLRRRQQARQAAVDSSRKISIAAENRLLPVLLLSPADISVHRMHCDLGRVTSGSALLAGGCDYPPANPLRGPAEIQLGFELKAQSSHQTGYIAVISAVVSPYDVLMVCHCHLSLSHVSVPGIAACSQAGSGVAAGSNRNRVRHMQVAAGPG
jgi:hypothetical protein